MSEYKVPIELLNGEGVEEPAPCKDDKEIEQEKEKLLSVLKDNGVNGTVISVWQGPTVTTYNVIWEGKTSNKKVLSLEYDIAFALGVNNVYCYVNFDEGAVSVQVPHKKRSAVAIGGLLQDERFSKKKEGTLPVAFGKGAKGENVVMDINRLVHTLVGGSSGSGKSVFVRSLLVSLLYQNSPQELNLLLIDPKRVEFGIYKGLPHLLTGEPIVDIEKACRALDWAILEMNRRYSLFTQTSKAGNCVVNIDEYNEKTDGEKLPKIVIVIDELADLMLCDKKGVEERLQSLTQKSRAAGIYLVVCSQRVSSDVISGVIKANFPTRVAFAVSTSVDSRVVLDQAGAERLLGRGDFLFTMPGFMSPRRIQAPYVCTENVKKLVEYLSSAYKGVENAELTNLLNRTASDFGCEPDELERNLEALRLVIQMGSASIATLQRKLSMGYSRAGRIIEWMENLGYITEFDGAKSRRVLITQEEYDKLYGNGVKMGSDEPIKEFDVRFYKNMQYLIRYPKGYKAGEKYPTVFFFHGAGTRGTDVKALMNNNFFTVAAKREDYPFVTIAAQCCEETWFDLWETVKSFVQEVTDYKFCDKSRVYAIGNSMGGYAVWQLGISMPWVFSAIVPICGGGMYWDAGRLKDLPVWAFHGEKDETVKLEESKKMVDAINACGGNAKLTTYPEVAHHSWDNAYVEPELFNWLLSHAKNK